MFAGIGGICLGLKKAGFDIVWANDFDKYACQTYRANFKDHNLIEEDIANISVTDIPNIDFLAAGFPCQSFSSIGKQGGFEDKRGLLFFEVVRVLKAKRPYGFLLENVKNLLSINQGKTFKVILNTLNDLGYTVHYKLINSKDFGVPQNRIRLYIVGFLEDITFNFPKEIPLNTFIEDLIEDNVDEKYYLSELMKNRLLEAYEKDKPVSEHQLMYDWYNRLWKKDGIAKTIRTNEGCSTAGTLLFPQMRRLTPRECSLLQGFPKDFIIPVSDTQAYKQFGNSVTVPVIEHIGLCIQSAVKDKEVEFEYAK